MSIGTMTLIVSIAVVALILVILFAIALKVIGRRPGELLPNANDGFLRSIERNRDR